MRAGAYWVPNRAVRDTPAADCSAAQSPAAPGWDSGAEHTAGPVAGYKAGFAGWNTGALAAAAPAGSETAAADVTGSAAACAPAAADAMAANAAEESAAEREAARN